MRIIHVCLIAMTAAVAGSLTTLVAQKTVQRSTTFEWAALEARPTQIGMRRTVMQAPTPTLEELEIHITTLNVGQVSHPPHQHPAEELLIVKEGMVETLQNGKATRVDHLPLLERHLQHPERGIDTCHVSRDPVEDAVGKETSCEAR